MTDNLIGRPPIVDEKRNESVSNPVGAEGPKNVPMSEKTIFTSEGGLRICSNGSVGRMVHQLDSLHNVIGEESSDYATQSDLQ